MSNIIQYHIPHYFVEWIILCVVVPLFGFMCIAFIWVWISVKNYIESKKYCHYHSQYAAHFYIL